MEEPAVGVGSWICKLGYMLDALLHDGDIAGEEFVGAFAGERDDVPLGPEGLCDCVNGDFVRGADGVAERADHLWELMHEVVLRDFDLVVRRAEVLCHLSSVGEVVVEPVRACARAVCVEIAE